MEDETTTYCFTINKDKKLTQLTKGKETLIEKGDFELSNAEGIAISATTTNAESPVKTQPSSSDQTPILEVEDLEIKPEFDSFDFKNSDGTITNITKIMNDLNEKSTNGKTESKRNNARQLYDKLVNIKDQYVSNNITNADDLKYEVQLARFGEDQLSQNASLLKGGKHTRKHKVRRNNKKSHKMKSNKTRGKKRGKKPKASRKYRK